jgi:hypothetical protein
MTHGNGLGFVDGGALNFAPANDGRGSISSLYDASGAGLGLDLTADPDFEQQGIMFDFSTSAFGGQALDATLTLSDGTDTETLMATIDGGMMGDPFSTTVSFLFSALAGLVDLGNLESIELTVAANNVQQDFVLDNIKTFGRQLNVVPEPASLTIFAGVGLAGAWYARRRRNRQHVAA